MTGSASSEIFLKDEKYYSILNFISITAFPFYLFGSFIILTKTPTKTGSIKLPLFMYHFLAILNDVTLSILTAPVPIYPEFAGYPLGILTQLGFRTEIQVYFAFTVVGTCGVSIVGLFENRHNHLTNLSSNKSSRSTIRIALMLFNYFTCFVFQIPTLLTLPNQTEGVMAIRKECPVIPEELFSRKGFLVIAINANPLFYLSYFLFLFLSLQIVYFGVSSFREIRYSKNCISNNTKVLQRQILQAIVLQSTLPLICIFIPFVYLGYSFEYMYYNQDLINLSLIIFSLHGLISTIVMLFVHIPYRKATKCYIVSISLRIPIFSQKVEPAQKSMWKKSIENHMIRTNLS